MGLVSKAVFLLTIFNKIVLNLFALSTFEEQELVRTLSEDISLNIVWDNLTRRNINNADNEE